MKKTLIIIVAVLLTASSFGQKGPKVKYKKGVITVDAVPFLTVEKSKAVQGSFFYNPNGEKLFFLKQESYTDRSKISQSNPQGNVSYSTVFQEGNPEALFEYGFGYKPFAKLLLEFEVLDENQQIIPENLENISAMMGFEYTKKMYAPK